MWPIPRLYTVASLEVLRPTWTRFKRYGMPNDMLVKLNVYDFRVKDVHVKPVYNVGENRDDPEGPVYHPAAWLLPAMWWQKYVIRNTHPLVLYLGGFMLLIDIPLALRLVYRWALNASVTVENVSAVLFCAFMGFQSILFAMLFDMEANKDLQGK